MFLVFLRYFAKRQKIQLEIVKGKLLNTILSKSGRAINTHCVGNMSQLYLVKSEALGPQKHGVVKWEDELFCWLNRLCVWSGPNCWNWKHPTSLTTVGTPATTEGGISTLLILSLFIFTHVGVWQSSFSWSVLTQLKAFFNFSESSHNPTEKVPQSNDVSTSVLSLSVRSRSEFRWDMFITQGLVDDCRGEGWRVNVYNKWQMGKNTVKGIGYKRAEWRKLHKVRAGCTGNQSTQRPHH